MGFIKVMKPEKVHQFMKHETCQKTLVPVNDFPIGEYGAQGAVVLGPLVPGSQGQEVVVKGYFDLFGRGGDKQIIKLLLGEKDMAAGPVAVASQLRRVEVLVQHSLLELLAVQCRIDVLEGSFDEAGVIRIDINFRTAVELLDREDVVLAGIDCAERKHWVLLAICRLYRWQRPGQSDSDTEADQENRQLPKRSRRCQAVVSSQRSTPPGLLT